ncbi:hypothetical protein C8J56DRAFT_1041974 [Mycena floridula]|nr:hypothetical protein C8J56DRAFT_1041974 [Mycena floridula]
MYLNFIFSGIFAFHAHAALVAPNSLSLTITSNITHEIPSTLYGYMWEDINHSGDGGLYGDLISWKPTNAALISVTSKTAGVSSALPNSLQVTIPKVISGPVGFVNTGFWGIKVQEGWTYKGSFYAKSSSFTGTIAASLKSTRSSWKKFTFEFTPTTSALNDDNLFSISVDGQQAAGKTIFFGLLFSLFPPTFKGRENGMRIDLAEALAGTGPSVLWNHDLDVIGDWGYPNTDGLGLLEYLNWAEDLGAEPVLGVWSGISIGNYSDLPDWPIVPKADLQPYIVINEIEFITGDAKTTKWGQFIEIGNEDLFQPDSYAAYRWSAFVDAIGAKYPDFEFLATSLPSTALTPAYKKSELNFISVVSLTTNVTAVHPGYGFLSENAKFSELLAQEGVVFIGPQQVRSLAWDRSSVFKNIMSAANVPCAQEIGFPVLIKATHGGGGKGMRTVSTATSEAFNESLSSAQRESLKAFGDDTEKSSRWACGLKADRVILSRFPPWGHSKRKEAFVGRFDREFGRTGSGGGVDALMLSVRHELSLFARLVDRGTGFKAETTIGSIITAELSCAPYYQSWAMVIYQRRGTCGWNFIHPMFGKTVVLVQIQVGETGVNIWLQAISVACADITSIFASVAAAYLNDTFGRRVAIRIGAIVYFFTGSYSSNFTPNLPWLITSRALQGIGVGILSTTVPVYQCEISPEHARGSFVSTEFFFLNCGYLTSAWFGYAMFFQMPSNITWRAPYMIQAFHHPSVWQRHWLLDWSKFRNIRLGSATIPARRRREAPVTRYLFNGMRKKPTPCLALPAPHFSNFELAAAVLNISFVGYPEEDSISSTFLAKRSPALGLLDGMFSMLAYEVSFMDHHARLYLSKPSLPMLYDVAEIARKSYWDRYVVNRVKDVAHGAKKGNAPSPLQLVAIGRPAKDACTSNKAIAVGPGSRQ